MQTFFLYRFKDISGVSGTGLVADGCVMSSGTCLIAWRTGPGISVHKSLQDAISIHGHSGATEFLFSSDNGDQYPCLSYLRKSKDLSGLSGLGIVAEIVEFENGFLGMQWLNPPHQIELYANKEHFDFVYTTSSHGLVTLTKEN